MPKIFCFMKNPDEIICMLSRICYFTHEEYFME